MQPHYIASLLSINTEYLSTIESSSLEDVS